MYSLYNVMKKYLKIFLALTSINFKLELEYRSVIFGGIILSAINLLITLFFINIYFSMTKSIFDWSREQVFLLTGLFKVFESTYRILFIKGVQRIPEMVTQGNLDLLLTKPVASQFLASFRYIKPFEFFTLLPGLILTIYAMSLLDTIIFSNIILLIIGLILGLLTFYGIHIMIATFVFWMGSFGSFTDLYYVITAPLAVPIDFFGKKLTFLFTFIIPLAFMVTIPVKLFLNVSPSYLILGSVIAMLSSLLLSNWFWNFALKHYTSASS